MKRALRYSPGAAGRSFSLAAILLLSACGAPAPSTNNGFTPPAALAGYTRYTLPVIEAIPPGSDILKCQWLAAPADHDQYITVVGGAQSKGGHHIVLYSNKKIEDVGTTRDCTTDDMLNIGFLGAFGGEGNSTGMGQIPDGVAFKLSKGQALMANTHFLNAGTAQFNGEGVIDIKFVDRSEVKQLANLFANLNLTFNVPQGTTGGADARCTFPQDVSFFRMANHMHEWGKSIDSSVLRLNGQTEEVTRNDSWSREMTFNFPFTTWPLEKPMTIHKGDTLTTHCTWANTAARDLRFPDEMCVVFGFYLATEGAQLTCQDGSWGG